LALFQEIKDIVQGKHVLRMSDLAAFERLLRQRGPLGLTDIAAALDCSTKTVQRLIASAGEAAVAADLRISRAFRAVCGANVDALARTMELV
jgi:hypothetical protein